MSRFQTKPREDGNGPYRWAHVVKTPKGFAQGTIYQQLGDDMNPQECAALTATCAKEGFDLRRIR